MKYKVSVDQELMKLYPELARLPIWIEADRINAFVEAIESRPEGMVIASIINKVIRVSAKQQTIRGKVDYLGMEILDPTSSAICDVIRDHTNIDPRRHTLYSKRGSAFEELSDDALIQPNYIKGAKRNRKPLDMISCEEVRERRELAERRWNPSNPKRVVPRKSESTEVKSNAVKDFLFKHKK